MRLLTVICLVFLAGCEALPVLDTGTAFDAPSGNYIVSLELVDTIEEASALCKSAPIEVCGCYYNIGSVHKIVSIKRTAILQHEVLHLIGKDHDEGETFCTDTSDIRM